MSRSPLEYLRHMLDETDYLMHERRGLEKEELLRDATLQRAFVRSIEIIGEASKKVPPEMWWQTKYPHFARRSWRSWNERTQPDGAGRSMHKGAETVICPATGPCRKGVQRLPPRSGMPRETFSGSRQSSSSPWAGGWPPERSRSVRNASRSAPWERSTKKRAVSRTETFSATAMVMNWLTLTPSRLAIRASWLLSDFGSRRGRWSFLAWVTLRSF